MIGKDKNDKVSVSLFDNNNKKIKTTFIHNNEHIINYQHFANIIYRDRNAIFVKDWRSGKWFTTSQNLFNEAMYHATRTKKLFDVNAFMWDFYEVQKKMAQCKYIRSF